ncbi:MAG: NAD(P)/FAD-dependent oxidoreductase [Deltaproteobacteria bacterium]|nr:NAD(P)/FAD-dependent oxidoreductase [Deltaproteobacteria bacterium]
MKNKHYDILVVGAGPAGSAAALTAAGLGAKVLVAERRDVIGVPVRCAEYIPRALLGELPFRDRAFVVQPVKAMRTVLPDGDVKETRAPGLIIRRDLLDQRLAECARKHGAEIRTGVRAVSNEDGEVVLKRCNGGIMRTRPGVIIGADGPHSMVGRWMGLGGGRVIPGIQVRVPLIGPMAHTDVYFHPKIFGAYGWLFPRGEEANVGIALAGGDFSTGALGNTLNGFVGRLVHDGRIRALPRKSMFGWIPTAPLDRVVKGNMMLAGDAAGHAHPITGAGIANAILAGRLAGKWAVEALGRGDLSALQGYAGELREELGEILKHGNDRRRLLERDWDRLSEILPYCWVAFREYFQEIPDRFAIKREAMGNCHDNT